MISLQHQNLQTAGRRLHHARSSGLAAAPEPLALPWGSPRTRTTCRSQMKPHPQTASSRMPAGEFVTLSLLAGVP